MKIFTLSEPDCGGKPTGYASIIENDNRSTLKNEIIKGLVTAWFFTDGMADSCVSEDELDSLHESGYVWVLDGRFLLEVTIMDE